MDSVYVTARGRIVIPTRLRRKLGIKPGTKVCFIEHGSEILFQPGTKEYVRSVCGMLKDTDLMNSQNAGPHQNCSC